MKKIISILTLTVFFAVVFTSSVYAHDGDVFSGKYLYNNQRNLKLRITQSAQTSIMNSNIYYGATAWNNISSNVTVAVIMEVPGMPTIANCMYVYGNKDAKLSMYTLGLTVPFDSNGNELGDAGVNLDWNYVKIIINTTTQIFERQSDPTLAAKMNFIHEVGHALKLSHPKADANLSGHKKEYNGYPYSVMNQGLPNSSSWVAPIVTSHDKSCLKAKWGV